MEVKFIARTGIRLFIGNGFDRAESALSALRGCPRSLARTDVTDGLAGSASSSLRFLVMILYGELREPLNLQRIPPYFPSNVYRNLGGEC